MVSNTQLTCNLRLLYPQKLRELLEDFHAMLDAETRMVEDLRHQTLHLTWVNLLFCILCTLLGTLASNTTSSSPR